MLVEEFRGSINVDRMSLLPDDVPVVWKCECDGDVESDSKGDK